MAASNSQYGVKLSPRVPKADPGRAHPYICPAGYWTIGYGHLCDAKHPPITEAPKSLLGLRGIFFGFAIRIKIEFC